MRNIYKYCSEVLLIRTLRGLETGPSRLFLPGLNFSPFAGSYGSKLILGSKFASEPVDLSNLYSKSLDAFSEEEARRLEANPAQQGFVIAHLASKGYQKDMLETEVDLLNITGLISYLGENKEIFEEAESRRLPAYVLHENGLLDQRMPDGSFIPAKFPSNIISFDTRVCSSEELKQQEEYLEKKYQSVIDEKANAKNYSSYLRFQKDLLELTINPIVIKVKNDIYDRALQINPEFKKDHEECQKKKDELRCEKAPKTVIKNYHDEEIEKRAVDARNAFYDKEDYDAISRYD